MKMSNRKVVGGFVAVMGVIAISAGALKEYAQCWANWSGTGFDYRYKMIGGCQVKAPGDELWVPAGRIRMEGED